MYSTVLVPLDGSAFAAHAIGPAVSLATGSRARLVLVRVHEGPRHGVYHTPTWEEFLREEEQAYVDAVAARLRSTPARDVDAVLLDGPVATAICTYATASPVPIIVMSTHGHTGIRRAWLGSVADGVLRHTTSPVLMFRPPSDAERDHGVRSSFGSVIVALDGSAFSEAVLPHALHLAAASKAPVVLLRVIESVDDLGGETNRREQRAACRYLRALAARSRGLDPSLAIDVAAPIAGAPGPAILASAAAHDRPLIALATHGHGLSRLFVGSVADSVLRGAPDAVLMVRPPGNP